MKKKLFFLSVSICWLLLGCFGTQSSDKNKLVNSLLEKMTLEEKIGQLNLPSLGEFVTGQAENSGIAKKIEKGLVGGVFNVKSVKKIRAIQELAIEKSRLKIPLIFGMDVIHGYESTFPIPLGLSCSWDLELIEAAAQVAAAEATSDGICWTFSPMVDICRDPRWGRIAEGSGEDPYLGGKIAAAMVRGYQGNDLSATNTMMACVKHFALYGAPDAGRDYNTVDMSRLRMYNDYFPPYKATIDAGAGSVMAAFNDLDGIPATGNRWLMTDVLRNQWGFKGFVVSDYTGINEMIAHGMGDLQAVSALALKAGVHMDMVGEGFLTTLKKSLEEGKITEDEITNATRLILEAKYDLGLFSDPYRYCDSARATKEVFSKKNLELVRRAAAESFVLLKNDNQLLPLKKTDKIALIGPLADATSNMTGTWSVAAKNENSISLLSGLRKAVGAKNVFYAKGANLIADEELEKRSAMWRPFERDPRSAHQMIQEALSSAKKSDVIIAALGEAAEMSGESSSRTNLNIPEIQKQLLRALLKTNKPIVLVLFTGRPLTIEQEAKTVPAILNVWFPGSQAGLSIADALFGDVNPSGKLTTTFPKNVGQIPIFYRHKNTGRPLDNEEGKFVKFQSNYLDVSNEPLYPFGYGLSYTSFSYSKPTLSSDLMGKGEEGITIDVKVENTGNYDGSEVVQLYIRDIVGSITRPVRELKKFQKVFIKKGTSEKVSFRLSEEDLKFYNADLQFVSEEGDFEVFVGGSSTTKNKATFRL